MIFKRRKPESIWVSAEGLGQLVNDINYDVGMSEMVHGPWIQVRPGLYENRHLFFVTLAPHLVDRLNRRVRQYEFSDVYGPRRDGTGAGGAPDGTE